MPKKQEHVKVDGRELTISNLDKIFFPETGFTKGDVIGFYNEIAGTILPHLRNRPLTMKRFPDGVAGDHFYEKNAPVHTPKWVETFAVPRSEGGSSINYILCNDRATLTWLANMADIEKHVLLARAPDLNHPTSIVFDLDPGEPANVIDCGEIALHLKKLFEKWGLKSFVKVSGSKGLHLSVPLNGDCTYEVTQPFAKTVAELVAHEMPERVVSEMSKSVRGGKVFIDWSQNSDFKTTVGVYAMRAKGGAPFVSMPVTWEELARAVKRKDEKRLVFSPAAAIKRIEKEGDLFAPVLKLKQELPATFTKALAAGPPVKLSRWPRNEKPLGVRREAQRHAAISRPREKPEGGVALRPPFGRTRPVASLPPHSKDARDMQAYEAKRKFGQTPEPPPKIARRESQRTGPHRFVIQKHQASHLHYDFRLEMQGVLRSWAVPKGVPTQTRESRLAMHVEDHPIDYGDFEGTIPPGNYGAGTVMLWDEGVYADISGNDAAAFHAGKMHIVMQGEKLKGEWILVKDKRDAEGNRWLLIKAGESMKPFSAKVDDKSVVSGRTMAQIAKANDAQWQSDRAAKGQKRNALRSHAIVAPKFVEPMKAKPVTTLPDDNNWTFEIKFDGYRCIATKIGDEVKLFSRNENVLNARFPNVVAALEKLPGDFTIDGEIVALDEKGRPSFQLLQNSQGRTLDAWYYVFDLLNRNSEEFLRAPIEQRRALLDELMTSPRDPVRRSALLEAPAGQVLEAVSRLGLEGVVGKRNGSIYEAGERSGAWIKQRTNAEQEFVIGGYKPGTHGVESLLVGVYEEKRLVYVARVKDGFVPRLRQEVFKKVKRLQTDQCPFVNLPEKKAARHGDPITAEKMKEYRWVKPKQVCQVSFVEWTDAGNLRHASFVALRDDKNPREVVREA